MNEIFEKLEKAVSINPKLIAYESYYEKIAWQDFYNRLLSLKENFIFIQRNEKVGIVLEHGINFIETVFLIWSYGGIPVPINPKSPIKEIVRKLNSINVSCLITEKELSEIPENITQKLTSNFKKHISPIESKLAITENENALIIFTSGSTGDSKPVFYTFENLISNAKNLINYFNLSSTNSWLSSLPFFHIGGFMPIIRALFTNSTLYFPEQTTNISVLNGINKFQPAFVSVVNPTLNYFEKNNLKPYKNLKAIFAGGGPINSKTISSLIKRNFPIYKVYGSTETTSMISILSPNDFAEKPKSAGKSFENIEIKISEEGEILVKGNQITKQEFNQSEYLQTGDIGFIDKDGFLFIKGRKSDFIISGGENVNLKKVESTILNLDGIEDCAVVGISDNYWGEKLVAFLVVNQKMESEKISENLVPNLEKWEIPKVYYFLDSIPQNEMGKVNRKKLMEIAK